MRRHLTYYIVQLNCDCGSTRAARRRDPFLNRYGPRCPTCNRIAGPVSWRLLGMVWADGDYDALKKFRKQGGGDGE